MINERALLVTLSLSKFEPKKTDKRITKQVLSANGSQPGTLRVAKTLLPDEAIEPIRKVHGEIRDYHYKHTLAWGENNERLLSSAHFLEYQAKMASYRDEHERLADAFALNYPAYVDAARVALNGAFLASDYPSQSSIRDKFRFRLDFGPVPDAGDFRISVMREAMDELRAGVDARIADATRGAQTDAARRIAEPLAAIVTRLSEPDAVFRDSLIGNLREICDLLPALNITGDPTLESARQRIRADLYDTDPDLLRENATVRASTARKAQNILDTMTSFFAPAA